MIIQDTAWKIIRQNAIKASLVNTVWRSIVKKSSYRLSDISDEQITILRLDTNTSEVLTKEQVFKAIQKFYTNNCRIKRGTLISPTVAEETALVLFHNNLSWDETGDFIIEI